MHTTRPSSSATSRTPLPDHRPFKLRKRAEQLYQHAADRRACINRLGQRTERGARPLYTIKDPEQVRQRTRKPVRFPDHNLYTRMKAI
jgi:hypothetical protein